MTWTKEAVTRLKQLWAEGHSGSEIADKMGLASRSVVLGKLFRLGQLGGRKKRNSHPTPRLRKRKDAPPMVPDLRPALKPVPLPEPPVCLPVAFGDRGHRQCAWPVGNDRPGPRMLVCGAPVVSGAKHPYCAWHFMASYQKRTPRERKGNFLAPGKAA